MSEDTESRWLTSINFKFDKGLVPSGSDLYYAIKMIRELNEQITELNDKLRANRETTKTIRKTRAKRSKQDGVRERSDIRTASSILKDKTLEGGS